MKYEIEHEALMQIARALYRPSSRADPWEPLGPLAKSPNVPHVTQSLLVSQHSPEGCATKPLLV